MWIMIAAVIGLLVGLFIGYMLAVDTANESSDVVVSPKPREKKANHEVVIFHCPGEEYGKLEILVDGVTTGRTNGFLPYAVRNVIKANLITIHDISANQAQSSMMEAIGTTRQDVSKSFGGITYNFKFIAWKERNVQITSNSAE